MPAPCQIVGKHKAFISILLLDVLLRRVQRAVTDTICKLSAAGAAAHTDPAG